MAYDLRADFGLDPEELRERFAFYFEAFPQVRRKVALTWPASTASGRGPMRSPRPGASRRSTWATASGCRRASNSYLIPTTDEGASSSTRAWDSRALCTVGCTTLSTGPRSDSIILTQGHFDHVGGVDCFLEDGTEVVAQANFETWRADNERLEAFRSRNAAFAWIDAILAAMAYAESLGVGATAPVPARTDRHLRRPPGAVHRGP